MAAYQSLYRRYRPQRFDEVLGQDHVTKALRNAVREGRVGHAYLFSGPRGTGKTSTARILAKVLNCEAPVDGEPCGKCENCVAVAEGRVIDWLLEQDAASKSKVDDMRDLIERVPLGTSGKRRVIILDEVHMLSQGAENALLKTLEEPPEHVVFVLATTDPQKVRPTIRSRTQHFEFRLLSPDVLADHVRHVIADAGLGLDAQAVDSAVDHVIRSGAGSARDTLSALDQVAALGEVFDVSAPVDGVLDALCARDAGAVLVAVADALAAGRDARTLGEDLIAALRDAFLAVMGAADEHVAPAQRERAARIGQRLGPAGLTRALDVLGESLSELARKPDPRVVVEVALVRLTLPATDRTLDAILERLDRLERGDGPGGGLSGGGGGTEAVSPSGAAAAAREALSNRRSGDANRSPEPAPAPTADKPTLGAVVRQQEDRGGGAEPAGPVEGAGGRIPDLDEITNAWTGAVLTALPKSVRSRWRGGRWIEPDPRSARFAVSNEWHQKACDESRRDVEEALLMHFGGPVPVAIVVEGEPADGTPVVPGSAMTEEPDHIDPAELRDAADAAVTGVDLVVRTFGGGELIQED
ncbi:MAG: DNA polymerase III subunit gamma/tau [Acidimicrobiales bacterium]